MMIKIQFLSVLFVLIIGLMSFPKVSLAVFGYTPDVQPMNGGLVELYGQTLNMDKTYYPVGSYSWDQIKGRLPHVLPEASEGSKTAEELCDHANLLYRLYSRDNREMIDTLAREFAAKQNPEDDSADSSAFLHKFYDNVANRLYGVSNKGLSELINAFGKEQTDRLKAAKSSAVSELLVSYVLDAAILNCSDHALKNGYGRVWTPSLDGSASEETKDPSP